jgi:CheY-like chemotaxis protein
VDIPVVLVSLADDEARAREAGAFAFVRRPFSPDVLVKAALEAEKDSRTARILIIDDHEDSLRLLEGILGEEAKFRIFTARSGMEGIQLVARRRPDLILLDLRMPDMDGFAVIRELRGNPETVNIPIVVVTSESLTAEEQAMLNNLRVMYKTDLANGGRGVFMDEVRLSLER